MSADSKIADALGIAIGAAVFHIELIHHESGIAIQIEDRFVLAEFAPLVLEQDFAVMTPSAYLSSISPLQEAEHVVRAAMPTETIRKHLEMGPQEPCLVVTRRTWAHGRPVSFANLYHPGSRFELSGHYVPPGTKAQVKRRLSGANTND